MLPHWIIEKIKKRENFIQEQLQIEDCDYIPPKRKDNKDDDAEKHEVIIIDLF